MCEVRWGPLFSPTGLLTLSCGSDRLFTSPLIKINGPSLLLGSLFPIHLSDGGRLPQWPLCPPNSDSFRTVSCTAPEERSALWVQINDMVLMTEGMTFILHQSSDLGDGDGMVMMGLMRSCWNKTMLFGKYTKKASENKLLKILEITCYEFLLGNISGIPLLALS